jgi:hypothetical protein
MFGGVSREMFEVFNEVRLVEEIILVAYLYE